MDLSVIIGIAVGTIVTCVLCILLIRLILRRKHKSRMAQLVAEGGGRLSRTPSSHMHISDEDVARMPGTSAAVRSSLPGFYSRSLYIPMSFRETPDPKLFLKNPEKVKTTHREATVPLQSWPLPRRLTRSDGTPLANIPTSSTSPKKKNADKRHSRTASAGFKTGQLTKDTQSNKVKVIQNRMDNIISQSGELRPKPLFHGRQHSTSPSITSQTDQGQHVVRAPYADAKEPGTKSIPRLLHSRSTSICSQGPGAAPTHFLPPLPFEIPPKGMRKFKSSTDFSTCESLFSDRTSVLNDEESRILSQAETDLTSVGLASPHETTPVSESRYKRLIPWGIGNFPEKASPVSAAKAPRSRPQFNTQKSFRASVQYSLPSCESSGLSMSLLDRGSHQGSSAGSPKEGSRANQGTGKASPSDAERKTDQRNSQFSLLKRSIKFESPEELKTKRSSSTALRPISGNEGWPMLKSWDRGPSFIAAEDPFQQDPHISMPSGKVNDGTKDDERPEGVQNSNIPLVVPPPPKPARMAEDKKSSPEEKSADTVVRMPAHREAAPLPSTKPTWDVRCTLRHNRTSTAGQTPPFSSTGAVIEFHGCTNSSSELAFNTPTRKPSRRTSLGDRLSNIVDKPLTASWRLSSSTNGEHPGSVAEINSTNRASKNLQDSPSQISSDPDSRPASYLFNFPNPPQRPAQPLWRLPKTPIRGPRLPPLSFHPTPTHHNLSFSPTHHRFSFSPSPKKSRSHSNSPPKSPSSRISKTHSTNSPSIDLRRSIMALRRQNSEVDVRGGKGSLEHKRYLSIGDLDLDGSDAESVYSEDGGGSGKENEGVGIVDGKAEKEAWRGGGRCVMPCELYDGEGFFREE